MENSRAIAINNVSKAFKIYHDKPLTLKEKLLRLRSNNYSKFEALTNVSIQIDKGETVALIGHNGCGKSTLLKLITKILRPDQGEIKVEGRISSLIELGAGFHPDFTGRENIYTNAAIFGLSKKEIDGKLNDIIEFSELGEFIENPVRTYSSGMYMRLAFSVAINVEPEVLLIDEILSVGDENFQKKCFEKIEGFKKSGATIVIVTHDLGTVEKLCDKVIWLDKGKIVQKGSPDKVVDMYQQYMNKKFVEHKQQQFDNLLSSKEKDNSESEDIEDNLAEVNDEKINDDRFTSDIRWGSREVEITDARILNQKGENTNIIAAGENITVAIDYKVNHPQREYIFGMGFYSSEGFQIYGNNTQIDRIKLTNINTKGTVKFHIHKCNLLSGKYKLNVAVVDGNHRALDFIKYYLDFSVISNDKSVGVCSIKHQWELK